MPHGPPPMMATFRTSFGSIFSPFSKKCFLKAKKKGPRDKIIPPEPSYQVILENAFHKSSRNTRSLFKTAKKKMNAK
jgi:hypothetical protein